MTDKKTIGVFVGSDKATPEENKALMGLVHANPDHEIVVVKESEAGNGRVFDYVTGAVPQGNTAPLWDGPTKPEGWDEPAEADDGPEVDADDEDGSEV